MTAAGHPATVKTTCPYCGVGCGVVAAPKQDGGLEISGDSDHPANRGRLCVKGSALGETVGLQGRLLYPMVHGQRSTWNKAAGMVADGFARTLAQYGPRSIAFYLSGQLLTEDYYVANKLMKGFLGSANVDTNSRLCMASSVAGHRRAFGSDTVPNCYEDIDAADLIVLVGSNAAWCHPVLFQRMQRAQAGRGTRIINLDPRHTATAAGADISLALASGSDTVLFSWLLVEIAAQGRVNRAYVDMHTNGFEAALAQARIIAPTLAAVVRDTGLSPADITAFTDAFIATARVVTCYSQGVNQSVHGTDTVNAILNCHLAMGRIGRPGCGPFSLTGQPNAMGGREVGGLSNMLAAHMGFSGEEVDRVRRFWQAPHMARREGLKAVAMFDAIARGEIKALWVMCTNPVVSLPRADAVREALRGLDLFVVSEALEGTDTTRAGAHVLFPAATWGEKDGTVTNSERCISRQRAFMPPPGEARPDWWIVSEVARRMGFAQAFDYPNAAAIFREHASLSAFENDGSRDFDIGAMAEITDPGFDALEPAQWPQARNTMPVARLFSEGGFFTPDRKARFVAPAAPALPRAADASWPLLLNTGRVRDHWHTMTRTGKANTLARHTAMPFVEVHPEDAAACDVVDGAYARVETVSGAVTLKVVVTAGQRRGMLFAPIHWNDATSGGARIGALVHDLVDPVSGQPDSKATPARLAPVAMLSEGFIISRLPMALPSWLSHARVAIPGGQGVLFASTRAPADLHGLLSNFLQSLGEHAEMKDPASGDFRTVVFNGERVVTALFVQKQRDLAAFDWVASHFSDPAIARSVRLALLSGRGLAGGANHGPLVCACHAVRKSAIEAAIAAGALDLDSVGAVTKAGTNCGSCRPEIKVLLQQASEKSAGAALGGNAGKPLPVLRAE